MKTKYFTLSAFIAIATVMAPRADACTGISLKAKTGDVVMARTIE